MALYSIYGNTVPSGSTASGGYTLGTVFQSSVVGNVNGVRFYKIAGDSSTHIGTLWSSGGTKLAQVTFTGETSSGWQYQAFVSSYSISAATNYTTSIYGSNINYYYPAFVASAGGVQSPLGSSASNYATGNAWPNTAGSMYYADLIFDDGGAWSPPSMNRDRVGSQCVVGAWQGISLGGPTSLFSDNTYTRHLQVGVRQENTQGDPTAPSLALDYPGFWRFRWGVTSGTRTISVYALQTSNVSGYRPTMIVKANSAIGINADTSATAPSGTGWVLIGPITITPNAAGPLWVELWNKDTSTFYSTAYFDHIVAT